MLKCVKGLYIPSQPLCLDGHSSNDTVMDIISAENLPVL